MCRVLAEAEGFVLAFYKATLLYKYSMPCKMLRSALKTIGCYHFLNAFVQIPPTGFSHNKKMPIPNLGFGIFWRKRRDSNPRGLAPKRFSRPPRYDHFDTLPNIIIIQLLLTKHFLSHEACLVMSDFGVFVHFVESHLVCSGYKQFTGLFATRFAPLRYASKNCAN